MFKKIIRATGQIISLCGGISGAVMLVIMVLTTINAVMRALGKPILGTTEIVMVGTAATIFLGFGYCALHEGHIRVDIVKAFPKIDYALDFIAVVFLPVLAVQCIKQGNFAMKVGNSTQTLGIPKFPFYWITGIGFIMMTLAVIIIDIRRILRERGEKKKLTVQADSDVPAVPDATAISGAGPGSPEEKPD